MWSLEHLFITRHAFNSLQETYEQKRSEHLREMQSREERMRQMFVQKVAPSEYTV